jgi:phosphate transport system substrate-binding protein
MAAASTTEPPRETIVHRRSSRTPLYAVVAVVAVVAIVLLVGFGAGWFAKHPGTSKPGSCPTGVTLLGGGASFITPIMSGWQKGFNSATGNTVSYSPSGAGAGITSLQNAQVDFAATDNPVNGSTLALMKGKVLTVPVTAGALAIVYNLPGYTAPLKLSGPVIADIYLGAITDWNDSRITSNNSGFNPGNQPIKPTIRSDSAGTTFVLTDFLSQESPAWATQVGKGISVAFPHLSTEVGANGNSGVYKHVLATPYSFGYVDLTDVLNNQVQYAKVLNPAGVYLAPNLADSASAIANKSATTTFPSPTGDWNNVSMVNSPGAGDYPLVTFAYAFVYQKTELGYQSGAAKSQTIFQFLNWTIGPGQALAPSLYYVTLPSKVLALDAVGLGSLTFNGGPIPACG